MSDKSSLSPEGGAAAIEERAAEWLQRRRYWKDWSAQDQAALEAWLAESMTHAVAFWRLESVLDRAERLSVLRPQKFQRPFGIARKRPSRMALRVAAVLSLISAVGIAMVYPTLQPRGQAYATSLGGHTTIKLTDGSSIELNTSTLIHADVRAGRRYVSIEKGEAYFDIVHDAKHPFIVEVAGHRITDLGTKFSVREETGRIEVTLLEGRASIASARPGVQAHSAVLTPGDVAVATADTISIEQKSKPTLAKELSWRRGFLVFDGAPLAAVAAELNRYNREKLVIAGDDVKRLTIDASVPTDDIHAFTRVARDVFGLHVRDQGNEVVISR